jgi:raffinose/stachyose/melibiose transport system permease protein
MLKNNTMNTFKIKVENSKAFPYFFIIPALIFCSLYLFFPIIFSYVISLFHWGGYDPISKANFIFFKNFINLFHDHIFWIALKNTLIFVLVAILFQNLLGSLIAIFLNYFKIRLSKLARAIIFFPAILSPVIIGLIWRLIFSQDGLINGILGTLGLGFLQKTWLGNVVTPIWIITFVNIWQYTGFNMVIYYAGLQAIPEELIEAALIDGANWRQIILKIIYPLLAVPASIAIVLNIIGGFKHFDLIYVMTGGGPAHTSEVLTTYMLFTSFGMSGPSDMGYASAIAVILSIIIFIGAWIRIRMSRNLEF